MIDVKKPPNEWLANRIADAIDESKFQGIEIAEACDVTPQAVTGWRKTGRIGKNTLSKLAVKLAKPVSYFLEEEQNVAQQTSSDDDLKNAAELMAILSRISQPDRMRVLAYARNIEDMRSVSSLVADNQS